MPDSQETTADPAVVEARSRRRRSGLGRGLGALIPELSQSGTDATVSEIDVAAVTPNPYQPRADFDDEAFAELVASISIHGVLQPIIVSFEPATERYVLIAGERRWRAAQRAGHDSIPALIKDATPQQMLEFAIIENVVRADLSPLEEAVAYRQLIDEFGLTQIEVAERVGRSRVSIANTMRLLFSPEAVKVALTNGEITEGHARALLALESPADQVAMLDRVIEKGLTVRQTEAAVREWLARSTRTRATTPAGLSSGSSVELATDRLQRYLSTRVTAKTNDAGKGTLSVHFDSLEQLEEIITRIAGEELF